MAYGDLDYTTKQINTAIGKVLSGEGGGSASIPVVVVEGATPTQELAPNTYYEFGEVESLTITLAAETPDIYNEYMFEFTAGSTPVTLSLPSDIKWIGAEAPTIEANKKYQVSIVNGVGVSGNVTTIATLVCENIEYYDNTHPLVSETVSITVDGNPITKDTQSFEYKIGSIVSANSGESGGYYISFIFVDSTSEHISTNSSFYEETYTIPKKLKSINININENQALP